MGVDATTPTTDFGSRSPKAGQPRGVLLSYAPQKLPHRRKADYAPDIGVGAVPGRELLKRLASMSSEELSDYFQSSAFRARTGNRDVLIYEMPENGGAQVIACANTGNFSSDIFAYASFLEQLGMKAAEVELTAQDDRGGVIGDPVRLKINGSSVYARLVKLPNNRLVIVTEGSREDRLHLSEELTDSLEKENTSLREQNEKLHTEATTDPLTGLVNRRIAQCKYDMFVSQLRRKKRKTQQKSKNLIALTEDEKECIAVFMIDIDHFKRVNDTYGHKVGDEALRHLASTINRIKRREDCFARFGGEEFVFIACTGGKREAYLLARRLQKAVADRPYQLADGALLPITISVGIYSFDPSRIDTSFSEAVNRADKRLYTAKSEGRYAIRQHWPLKLSRLDKRYQLT